jgi:hypothetical protein
MVNRLLLFIIINFLGGSIYGMDMDSISQRYVKLVLALGEHDAGYVDAYYGPAQWNDEVKKEKKSIDSIRKEAEGLIADLKGMKIASEEMERLRHDYLTRQLQALVARTKLLEGIRMSFDDESRALYDAAAPIHKESDFKMMLDEIGKLLPGEGSIQERYQEFRNQFIIPKEKLDTVFRRAIEECRGRTAKNFPLPEGEAFRLEYATNKPWGGYNWYQGNFQSLIQINTDLPIFIDRAVDLACHEGYPGHHVYNMMLEKNLVKDRGWMEYTVYPLYSPQSLIAEGSANYGIEIAFPGTERVDFERTVLFPLAGLSAEKAELYYRIAELVSRLSYAGNEAARNYLNGDFTAQQAIEWMQTYSLMEPERAKQRLKFIEQYRSYVINYNLGKDLVARYIESHGGIEKRWPEFYRLISSPRLPSGLTPKH